MQRHTITLDHPTDWQGFRTAARALVQATCPLQAVDWRCQADAAEDLFAPGLPGHKRLPPPAPMRPRCACPRLCAPVRAAHPAPRPARFALMYRLLWRMAQGGDMARAARHDPLDADRMQATTWCAPCG